MADKTVSTTTPTGSIPKRPKRTRSVSFFVPDEVGEQMEDLKYVLRDDGVRIAGRQLIGLNGIALATVSWMTTLPAEEQYRIINLGVERLQKIGADAPSN